MSSAWIGYRGHLGVAGGSWSTGALGMRLGRVGTSLSHVKTFEQGQFQSSSLSLSKLTKLTPQIKGTLLLLGFPILCIRARGRCLLVTV